MQIKPILGGVKSLLPLPFTYTGTGGTARAAYCYTVWLRHLALVRQAFPGFQANTLVEFGPGDTIGTGLAALLTGTERYYALDVLRHASTDANLAALDQLVALVAERAPLAGDDEFPGVHPRLPAYDFAQVGLADDILAASLDPARLARLRQELLHGPPSRNPFLTYVCPWHTSTEIPLGSVDMVLGQVVLQDMDDEHDEDVLATALRASSRWLRRGGVLSQQVDFSMPGTTAWNDHWTYPDAVWRIVRGRRPYYPNRAPLSRYLAVCRSMDLEVVTVIPVRDRAGRPRPSLTSRFRSLDEDDLTTRCAYLLATKTR